jgi:HlyD family secretion protein
MKPKFTRAGIAFLAVLLSIPLLALGSKQFWSRSSASTPLRVVQVRTGDLVSAITATGTVEAHRTVDIKYDTQSLVTRLDVHEGNQVAVNQPLATMDVRLLEPALAEARQTFQKDQANLALAEASLHRSQALAAAQVLAEVDLETADANYKALLHQTEADRGAVTLAEEQIDRATLRSPIRGVVIALYVHEGEMLGSATAVAGLGPNAAVSKPTNVLMTIAEDGALEVDADVNAVDMGGVFVGQEAKLTLDASPARVFTGRVRSVALQPTVSSGVTTYRVIISIPKPSLVFRIGMPANIMLFHKVAPAAILVPASAILREAGRTYVFAIETSTSEIAASVGNQTTRAPTIRLKKIEVEIVGETPSASAVHGELAPTTRVALVAEPKLEMAELLNGAVTDLPFTPNPDLSFAPSERATPDGPTSNSLPAPQPKSFFERVLNP